jgi:photosystem II stability/assembly factor-like uncharacterized protein
MKTLFVFVFALLASFSFAQQQPQEDKQGWFRQESGTQENLRLVQFFSPTNGWICGEGGKAYHTSDAGEHWTKFEPLQYYRYFYFLDNNTGIAVGATPDGKRSTVISTSDMGETWSEGYQDNVYSKPLLTLLISAIQYGCFMKRLFSGVSIEV